jgi:hypothetical protein
MNFNELPIIMLKCLLLTILIECIIGFIIGVRDKKDLLNILLVNILTNPIVVSIPVLVMLKSTPTNRYYCLFILEIVTFLIEGFIYSKVFKYKKINPYIVSLIMNLGSYFIGEIIYNIF